MKMRLIIFILCIVQVYCAVSILETTVTDEERAEGYSCKSDDESVGLMRHGEVKQYGTAHCIQVRCGTGLLTFFSCPTIRGPPECQLVSDLSQPYPDCCPKIVC